MNNHIEITEKGLDELFVEVILDNMMIVTNCFSFLMMRNSMKRSRAEIRRQELLKSYSKKKSQKTTDTKKKKKKVKLD